MVLGPAPVDFFSEDFKEKWDYDQQMQEDEPGQVLLLKGGMYGDSPVRRLMPSILYGRRLKNLSAIEAMCSLPY